MHRRVVINDGLRGWPERIFFGFFIAILAILGLAFVVLIVGLGAAAALGLTARAWWLRRRLEREGAHSHASVIEGKYRVLERHTDARSGGPHA